MHYVLYIFVIFRQLCYIFFIYILGQTNSLNSRRPHNNFTEEASLSDTDMEINEAPRKINRHITKHIPAKGDADSLRNSSDVDTIANQKVTQQSGKHEANNIREIEDSVDTLKC